jgi:hypothetical protein
MKSFVSITYNEWCAFLAQQPGIELDLTCCLYPFHTIAFKFSAEKSFKPLFF